MRSYFRRDEKNLRLTKKHAHFGWQCGADHEEAHTLLDDFGYKSYQQEPNNRTLLLPFIHGSQAERVRLTDFLPSKDANFILQPKIKNHW